MKKTQLMRGPSGTRLVRKSAKNRTRGSQKSYAHEIRVIKNAILKSRYRAAALANKELLSLYYGIGKYISDNSRNNYWGTGAIETISEKLQKELPGLRGFSVANLKKMRIFYEQWCEYISNRSMASNDLKKPVMQEIQLNLLDFNNMLPKHVLKTGKRRQISSSLNRSMASNDFRYFLLIGFSHHYEIIAKTTSPQERLFYIEHCATEFWSIDKLRYHLKSKLFKKQGKFPNNFKTAISNKELQRKALLSFKDEYLLDYINIESSEDEPDERVLENEVVRNIRKFIMSLGKDFTFIGNQYRLVIEKCEYFIDLLFYNRRIQSLIAIELKRGDFKPEYLGKMNFYLSALDDEVRLPHENPSIGIILCKTKTKRIVEYAFRDINKPMGVAGYKTASELPLKYRKILPDAKKLMKLL